MRHRRLWTSGSENAKVVRWKARMARAFGSRLGSYEILSPLGAGGMGEVYRALDLKLNREVALKVLRDAVATDSGLLERLGHEGRVLASLNHPNIAMIHGLEESDGACALVLELVEGPTLAQRVKSGPIGIEEVLTIAAQVAAALEAAHARGVTHRDLKPANVKLTLEGRVKLLDFGLAKVLRFEDVSTVATVTTATEAGMILGTPAYMSPEQARGQRVDKRTDIWAFGCLLYELLTGRQAFRGETIFDIIAAVLEREPDFGAFGSATPANIQDLVRQCLQKDLPRRLSDIADARIEIDETLRAGSHARRPAAGPTFASLAVLPFVNTSGDAEMDYLSEGLTTSIILNLSQLPNLRVMARSTVFQYRGRDEEAKAIGDQLRVDSVLTGRVLQRGEALLINAELMDVKNGWQLWGAQYRRTVSDIFATEEEIAQEITSALRLKLTLDNQYLLRRRYTDNVQAYQLYLKGRFYWEKRTAQALHKAIHLFSQAIEIDPTYALAYAGLAEAYVPLCFYGHIRPRDGFQKARAAALKALEIDPGLAEALAVMGWVKGRYDWNPSAAEDTLRKAVALNPNYARARQALAEVLVATARLNDADAEMTRALELEPLSLSINAAVGLIAYFGHQYHKAIECFRQTIELDPTFYPAHWYLAWAYEQIGQLSEAEAELREAQALSHDNTLVIASLSGIYAAAGRANEARTILAELEDLSSRTYVSQLLIAVVAARLGDRERAVRCLELACEDRCPWLGFAMVDPKLDILRGDRGFEEVAHKIGLAAYIHGR